MQATIIKTDDDRRLVYGWASVFEESGQPVVDRQSDRIAADEALAMAHGFVAKRMIKAMHSGPVIGELVESLVLTSDLQAAMGISLEKAGWFVGIKVHDEATWQRVKAGELTTLSIAGAAQRNPVEAAV